MSPRSKVIQQFCWEPTRITEQNRPPDTLIFCLHGFNSTAGSGGEGVGGRVMQKINFLILISFGAPSRNVPICKKNICVGISVNFDKN